MTSTLLSDPMAYLESTEKVAKIGLWASNRSRFERLQRDVVDF